MILRLKFILSLHKFLTNVFFFAFAVTFAWYKYALTLLPAPRKSSKMLFFTVSLNVHKLLQKCVLSNFLRNCFRLIGRMHVRRNYHSDSDRLYLMTISTKANLVFTYEHNMIWVDCWDVRFEIGGFGTCRVLHSSRAGTPDPVHRDSGYNLFIEI